MFTTVFQNAKASSYTRSCERGRASFVPTAICDGLENTIEKGRFVRRSCNIWGRGDGEER